MARFGSILETGVVLKVDVSAELESVAFHVRADFGHLRKEAGHQPIGPGAVVVLESGVVKGCRDVLAFEAGGKGGIERGYASARDEKDSFIGGGFSFFIMSMCAQKKECACRRDKQQKR